VPLGPFTVNCWPLVVISTASGSTTGIFATLDMFFTRLA
jgi:hypothetical protein